MVKQTAVSVKSVEGEQERPTDSMRRLILPVSNLFRHMRNSIFQIIPWCGIRVMILKALKYTDV